jgi:hypothetical protein
MTVDEPLFVLLTGVFGCIAAVLSVLAAATPQWFVVYPNGISFGLGTTCAAGGGCGATNYRSASCGSPLKSIGEDWHNREASVEAFVWMAIILVALVVIAQAQLLKGINTSMGAIIAPVVFTGASCLFLIIAMAIYGHTWNEFVGCGKTFCDQIGAGKREECGYGMSFACIVTGFVMCVLLLAPLILQLVMKDSPHQGKFRILAIALAAFALALIVTGATTSRWYVNNDKELSAGMFDYCRGGDCRNNNYRGQTLANAAGTCSKSGADFDDRNKVVGSFFIIGFLLLLVAGVAAVLSRAGVLSLSTKVLRIVVAALVGAALLFQVIGYIIFGSTWNSWLLCGNSYCNSNNCNYGFSAVCAVSSMVVAALIFVATVLELLGIWSTGARGGAPGGNANPLDH